MSKRAREESKAEVATVPVTSTDATDNNLAEEIKVSSSECSLLVYHHCEGAEIRLVPNREISDEELASLRRLTIATRNPDGEIGAAAIYGKWNKPPYKVVIGVHSFATPVDRIFVMFDEL